MRLPLMIPHSSREKVCRASGGELPHTALGRKRPTGSTAGCDYCVTFDFDLSSQRLGIFPQQLSFDEFVEPTARRLKGSATHRCD